MPNTLAHLGINGLSTRTIIRDADLKWVFLGCIIPDFPWIFQRLIHFMLPSINGYDLRLYVIVQSSLFFSIILSLWLSSFSIYRLKIFFILSIGSFLHLLTDALQIKWGNGVLLLAPFDWNLINIGLFWPESLPTYVITLFGLVYVIIFWKNATKSDLGIKFRSASFHLSYLLVLIFYITVPPFFTNHSYKADNHYVKTLKKFEVRDGKHIEFDRRKVTVNNHKVLLETFADENLKLVPANFFNSGVYSIKGKFEGNNTIRVSEYHKHSVIFRDGASYLGIIIVLVIWMLSVFNFFKKRKVR